MSECVSSLDTDNNKELVFSSLDPDYNKELVFPQDLVDMDKFLTDKDIREDETLQSIVEMIHYTHKKFRKAYFHQQTKTKAAGEQTNCFLEPNLFFLAERTFLLLWVRLLYFTKQ